MPLSGRFNIQKNKGFFSSWKLLSYGCFFFLAQALHPVYAKKYDANALYEYVKLNQSLPDFVEDINVMTKSHGQTALHLAVENDDLESASILLEAGADVRRAKYLTEEQVGSVLHCVKSVEVARLLLEHGADINSQEIFYRTTPLLQAVLRQDKDLIEFLLEQGADANTGAVEENDKQFFIMQEAVHFFLEAQVCGVLFSVWRFSIPQFISILGTPIAVGGAIRTISELLGYENKLVMFALTALSVPPSIVAGFFGAAYFSRNVAEYSGRDKDLTHRIKHELAKLNIPPVKAEQLPILAAIELKDNELVDILLEYNADPNVTNKRLRETLAQAIITYRKDEDAAIELMKRLVESGADVGKKHKRLFSIDDDRRLRSSLDYDSALDLAHKYKCHKIVDFLLAQSALNLDLEEQAHKPDAWGSSHHNDRFKPKAHRPVRDIKLRKPVFTAPRLAPVIHKPNWVSLR